MRSPRLRWRRSLRKQLIATYVAALLMATAGVAALLVAEVGWDASGLTSKRLVQQACWIEQGLQFDATGKPFALADDHHAPWVYESASEDLKYRVLNAAGDVLLASEPNASLLTPQGQPFDPSQPMFETVIGGLRLFVMTVPMQRPGAALYIQTARSERIDSLERHALGSPLLKVAIWVGLGSMVLFGVAVYVTLSSTLRPLRRASEAASRIEPNNLSTRLETRDLPAEITPLVDAFNLALGRLERGFRVQQEFLAGAAHELKTPLALIRGQIEMNGNADRATLLRDVDLMARQVHQLLHLAEVSEAQNYVYAPTDLCSVASEVMDHLGRLADRRQVALHLLSPAAHTLHKADHSAMFVLIRNLVENAIRHSPAGGVVTLELSPNRLEVRDEGAGIAAADLPHLFARFWRGADQRDEGVGLGLAICREIASVHGWGLTARNAKSGAVFSLDFQLA